ncbi:type II toxin-antitoxin system VapB family antitoxin [Nocardia sp. NPDC059764]|uniref:type II toxin-antitoxin system VapB family antitoxin n=1 Tax=Nocardia sp. NPDC059764 TaxID=3346939 RepID=UPI003664E21D
MTRTMIDLDDDLLAKAAKELGTTTKKDTVHAALRVALRQSAARNLRAMMAADPDGLAHEATVNAMWEDRDQAHTA